VKKLCQTFQYLHVMALGLLPHSPIFIFSSFQLYHNRKLSSSPSIDAYDVGVFSKVDVFLFVNFHLCYFMGVYSSFTIISFCLNIVFNSGVFFFCNHNMMLQVFPQNKHKLQLSQLLNFRSIISIVRL
jgi:hypothetical protein